MSLSVPIDYSWSFSDKTQKDTSYITHSYYTYPAKFIPQLANRLIKEYSKDGDLITDPFMGSGTTIVESLVSNRKAIGVDINQIAYLLTKVKITPLNIEQLKDEFFTLENLFCHTKSLFSNYKESQLAEIKNERLDYWFRVNEKNSLSKLLQHINMIQNGDIRDFFYICFSQILKSSSLWLQKSIKPTRDLNKKEAQVYKLFFAHAKKMIKKHEEYQSFLNKNILDSIHYYCNISCGDSRSLNTQDNSVDLIVTSPPYVTSYEYADLHQLPSLWLGYLDDLASFRKKFIGSSAKVRGKIDLQSNMADEIISQLGNKKQMEVQNYYADMLESFLEMKRILKSKGKACIVIGNTQFKGVDILNAEVFCEQMQNLGFKIHNIIHREIPSKMLPSTRDSSTGRFSKRQDTDKLAYPTEYILIMEKQ
ncbi:DNA methyltransferase [Helicobacter muridarum]|uniref:Methyltransferase n=1 Tax=Helicobacter muridarum TaxID=216 RepID=A0A377PV90_9HELI|nr:DNA methyltransferase [Helicobacter muridarum]STQ86888.1 DNA methyltransferase C1 [Helicobacter muridarum]